MSAAESTGYTLQRGESPLLVSVPHCGTALPEELKRRLVPEALTLPDTDWHVHRLYDFAPALDVTCLFAHYSRYLIDLNRDPSGASLYPGQSVTELCPTTAFDGSELYQPGQAPEEAEQRTRRTQYFEPYHRALQAELARLKARHGFAILLDGHSIRAEVPRFFEGRLPSLNLGTADGSSCDAALQEVACEVLESCGMSWVANGRFKGGYITRRFGQPAHSVHALQLEMAQAEYMLEAPPYAWDEARAEPLRGVLERLVRALLAWRPAVRGAAEQGGSA
ncbi:MAG: N-formylglutamate deformylase [Polyangiaceae bacterium]|nr:N-formylglutamate deformylase [Myxococcales bacterium]MCB9587505.1 N-formylglutamate deformylase [Polyangiaceae bacterium]MCB9605698.1 N-formylglutamate deformylase [Polyangiaceae bacterium]